MWVFPSGDVHLVTESQMTVDLRVVVQVPDLLVRAAARLQVADRLLQAPARPPVQFRQIGRASWTERV